MDKVQLPISPAKAHDSTEKREALPNAMPTAPPVLPVSKVESELQDERRRTQALETQLGEMEQAFQTQREGLKTEIYQEIYQEAFRNGLNDAHAEIEKVENVYSQLLNSLSEGFSQLEDDIAQIVLASTGKILGQQLVRPEMAVAAVKEVLRTAGHQELMRVHVSPADHQILERYRRQISTASNLEFVADDRVTIGGCLVELDRGMLDGRIEIQLQTLVDTLTQVRKPRA